VCLGQSCRIAGSKRVEEDQGQEVNTSEMGHHNERYPKGRLFRAASDFYRCLTLCYITKSTGQRNEALYPAIIDIQDNRRGNLAESVSMRARCKVQVRRAVLPALSFVLRSADLVWKMFASESVILIGQVFQQGNPYNSPAVFETPRLPLLCAMCCCACAIQSSLLAGSGPKGWRHERG
jgi:hypothetical protein